MQHTSDDRAQLEARLAYLLTLLRWIDARWHEKAAIAQKYQQLIPVKKRWGALALSLWAIGLVVASFTIGAPVTGALYEVVFAPFFDLTWAEAHQGAMIAMMLAVPIALSVALAFLIVSLRNTVILSAQHARAERINKQREIHNDGVQVEEQRVDAQLYQASRDFATHIGDSFPQKYLYEEDVAFCLTLVQNHRATTVPEVINLFETERHRQRMEDLQAWQLDEARRTRKLVAVGTVVNAAMQGAIIGTLRDEGRQTRDVIKTVFR